MISVVIPTYNRAKLIRRAIVSVLEQTYTDLELIVVDDGSLDNTADVIGAINDPRVKYIWQQNSGACVARNKGIIKASGEYIAFHDSDDVWHKDKLEKQFTVLQETNASVVFCRMNKIVGGQKKGVISNYFKEGFQTKDVLPFSIGTQTLIGKASVFRNEFFDKTMPRFQEFELLLRIQKKHSIYCMDEALVDYHIQEDSISRKPEKFIEAWRMILNKYPYFLKTYSTSRDRIAADVLKNAFEIKNIKQRMDMISLAFLFKNSPKMIFRLARLQLFSGFFEI